MATASPSVRSVTETSTRGGYTSCWSTVSVAAGFRASITTREMAATLPVMVTVPLTTLAAVVWMAYRQNWPASSPAVLEAMDPMAKVVGGATLVAVNALCIHAANSRRCRSLGTVSPGYATFAEDPLSWVVDVTMDASTSADTPRHVAVWARVSALATPPVNVMAGITSLVCQIRPKMASLPNSARVAHPAGWFGTPVPELRMDACTSTRSPAAVPAATTGVTLALLAVALVPAPTYVMVLTGAPPHDRARPDAVMWGCAGEHHHVRGGGHQRHRQQRQRDPGGGRWHGRR